MMPGLNDIAESRFPQYLFYDIFEKTCKETVSQQMLIFANLTTVFNYSVFF